MKILVHLFFKHIVTIIFSLAILLRLIVFFNNDFWEDELWSYNFITTERNIFKQITEPSDDRPPLYYALGTLYPMSWMQSDYAGYLLRLPSFISSLILLIVLYQLLATYDRKTAVVWLVVGSFSIDLVQRSWQARDYGLMVFATSLLIVQLCKWFNELVKKLPTSRERIIKLGLCLMFAGMCNYAFLPFFTSLTLALAVVILVYLPINGKQKWHALFSWALASTPLLAAVVYFLLVGYQLEVIGTTTTWIPRPQPISWLGLNANLFNFNNYFFAYDEANDQELQRLFYRNVWIFIFTCTGAFLAWRKAKWLSPVFRLWLPLTGITYALNVAIVYGISIFSARSVFLPRFFSPLSLMVLVCLSILGATLVQFVRPVARKWVALLFSLVYVSSFLQMYSSQHQIFTIYKPASQPIKEAIGYAKNKITDQDLLVFVPSHYQFLYPPYYFREIHARQANDVVSINQQLIANESPQILGYRKLIIFVLEHLQAEWDSGVDSVYHADNWHRYQKWLSLCETPVIDEFSNVEFKIKTCLISDNVSLSF